MADTEVDPHIETIGAEFFADPHSHYRSWRERGPVCRIRFPDGVVRWLILGHAAGQAALGDPRLRKDARGTDRLLSITRQVPPSSDPHTLALITHMLNTDPPEYTRLCELASRAFTPGRIAALRPRIEQITTELLDALDGRDEVDLMREFAVPLRSQVNCELLGVPMSDRDAFQEWSKTLVAVVGSGRERARTSAAMAGFLTRLVRDKREHPGEDLLSGLIYPGVSETVAAEDHSLTERELVAMAFLLLVAGHETAVNLIGNGMLALLRDRVRLHGLRADRTVVPAAVEEILRCDGLADMATVRYTATPITVAGTEIPAGELVYVVLAAANRAPRRNRAPEDFDTSGHLGFGHGIHFCLGAPVARLEAQIALTALLQRFPQMHLSPSAPPIRWRTSTLTRGILEFRVRLDARTA